MHIALADYNADSAEFRQLIQQIKEGVDLNGKEISAVNIELPTLLEFHLTSPVLEEFFHALAMNKTIYSIDFARLRCVVDKTGSVFTIHHAGRLTPTTAELLEKVLNNRNIEKLRFQEGVLCNPSLTIIVNALRTNNTVRHLEISGRYHCESICYLIDLLESNTTLERLVLDVDDEDQKLTSRNSIVDRLSKRLLYNTTLHHLDLSMLNSARILQNICVKSVENLMHFFYVNKTLRSLKLAGSLSYEKYLAIATAIKNNNGLEKLELSSVLPEENSVFQQITEAIHQHKTLRSLNLNLQECSIESLELFSNMLKSNDNLEEFICFRRSGVQEFDNIWREIDRKLAINKKEKLVQTKCALIAFTELQKKENSLHDLFDPTLLDYIGNYLNRRSMVKLRL